MARIQQLDSLDSWRSCWLPCTRYLVLSSRSGAGHMSVDPCAIKMTVGLSSRRFRAPGRVLRPANVYLRVRDGFLRGLGFGHDRSLRESQVAVQAVLVFTVDRVEGMGSASFLPYALLSVHRRRRRRRRRRCG